MQRMMLLILVALGTLHTPNVFAEMTLRWESFTAVAHNPLGLNSIFTSSLRHPLYSSESPLFSQNFIEGSLILASSPAYGILGYQVQLQPLSILRLRLRHEAIAYYGTFGHIQSFETPFVDFSDAQLVENADDGLSGATQGNRLTMTVLLQAKIGSLAVRNHLQMARMKLDIPERRPVFYSPYDDHLLQNEEWFFQNDMDVLFVHPSVVFGIRYTLQFTSFSPEVASEDPHGPAQRIGPLVVFPLYKHEGLLDQISLIFLVNWHLTHSHRAGQNSPQWLPYTGLAISFEGSLF